MKKILYIFLIFFTLLAARVKENQLKINFEGEDRPLTSINWNATNINFSLVQVSNYDLGYLEIPDMVVISELSSNTQIKITATHNGWDVLPDGYSGNKNSTGGDLLIFADNLTGGLVEYSGSNYGTTYSSITNSANNHILESGSTASDATGDINGRILLDWTNDVKGNYNVSIQLTVTNY